LCAELKNCAAGRRIFDILGKMTRFDQPIVTICEYGPGSHMNFVGANFALTKSINQIAAHPDRIKNSFVKIWSGL